MVWISSPVTRTCLALSTLIALPGATARGDQNYSQQVFFDNSLSPDSYFYSSGKASAPSALKLIDGKLPIDSSTFISAPNSLQVQWTSMAAGGWSAEIKLYEWRNRTRQFPGSPCSSGSVPQKQCARRTCRMSLCATGRRLYPAARSGCFCPRPAARQMDTRGRSPGFVS